MNKLLNALKKQKLFSLMLVSTTIIGVFSSYTMLVYELGRSTLSDHGITLLRKFSFKSIFSEKDLDVDKSTINLDKLYLVKALIQPSDTEDLYIVKQITNDPRAIITTGSVVTKKQQTNQNEYFKAFVKFLQKFLSLDLSNLTLTEIAYAQQTFEWYGYENNYDFHEKYIDELTIRRFYGDGAVLEYKVNSQGASIPSTFKWIKRPTSLGLIEQR